jgi:AbrB family looped-hinge helix DNA binding protein
MHTTTLTSKFQLSIPKAIRDKLKLEAGQQFIFVTKGETITMVPKRGIGEIRGLLKGANPGNYRDRQDRA